MSVHEAPSSSPLVSDETKLQTFLQELRILLPGTQLLGGFLLSVPFQPRYERLLPSQRTVLLATFLSTLVALALFMTPAIYHRLATPIHNKRRFISIGTRFVIAGFVPLGVSTVLSVHLVVSLVLGVTAAHVIALSFALFVLCCWWIVPAMRPHERAAEAKN